MIIYCLEDVKIELIKRGIFPKEKMAIDKHGMHRSGLCFYVASVLKGMYIKLAEDLVKTSNMKVYYDQFSEEVNIDLWDKYCAGCYLYPLLVF